MGVRRGRADPLDTTDEPRWLVVRDRVSRPLEFVALAAGANLRAALAAKQAKLTATGWRVDVIARKCAFFFADHDNERVCVSIECFEPAPTRVPRLRR